MVRDEHGYLADPDSAYHPRGQARAVRYREIADKPCLALLGEPGIGKTTTLGLARDDEGEGGRLGLDIVLVRDLRLYHSYDHLRRDIFDDDGFKRWHAGGGHLELFLDSLDECLLRIDTVASILEAELARCPPERLRLRIACRSADWPESLERFLRRHWAKDAVGVYELAQLRREDVAEAARCVGIVPDRFLAAIEGREAVPLAITPVTLELLLNAFRLDRELPRTRAELYLEGCRLLCQEHGVGRRNPPILRLRVDPARRLVVASRIAAAMTFCGRSAIWTEPDRGDVPEGDVTIADLVGRGGQRGGTPDVSEAEIRDALDTGLFSSRGPGRMGFAHRTYAEFLATRHLHDRALEEEQVASLLLHPEDDGGRVIPQLHEVAAWLAGMDPRVSRRIMRGDPQVLVRGDISAMPEEDRRSLVEALLDLFEGGGVTSTGLGLVSRYPRLDHPGLAGQIAPYITGRDMGQEVRCFAIALAVACGKVGLRSALADVSLAPEDDILVRALAANAIARIGDDHARLQLLPILTGEAGPDPHDEIKGEALMALWPRLIDIDRVLAAITPPKKSNFLGMYRLFLYSKFVANLSDEDLPQALRWAAGNITDGDRPAEGEIAEIIEALVERSLRRLDDPAMIEAFAGLVVAQLASDFPLSPMGRPGPAPEALADPAVRRPIVRAIIARLAALDLNPNLLRFLSPTLVFSSDLAWVLDDLGSAKDESIHRTWARLARSVYDGSPEHAGLVRRAMKLDRVLTDEVRSFFTDQPPDPPSRGGASSLPGVEPSAPGRVPGPPVTTESLISPIMEAFESGDIEAWYDFVGVLEAHSNTRPFSDLLEADLTAFPRWAELGLATRSRIIDAASAYLVGHPGLADDWIEANALDRRVLAALRAFHLIDTQRPGGCSALPSGAWCRWASSIIGTLYNGDPRGRAAFDRLAGLAFAQSPDRCIATVIRLIDRDNERTDLHLFVLDRLWSLWGPTLAAALLAKVMDPRLRPDTMGLLLEALITREAPSAEETAVSLATPPFPSVGEPRARALAAARAIVRAGASSTWPIIEATIRLDPAAARELFLGGAWEDWHVGLAGRLAEDQLDILYRWLCREFPPTDDPSLDDSSQVTTRGRLGFNRDHLLGELVGRGTAAARLAVERLAADLPEIPWLKREATRATMNTLRQTWEPLAPGPFFALLGDPHHRLVVSGLHLLDLIVESIGRLELELQGETPLAAALWDQVRPKVFRPKDENWLSDFVAAHLRRDLAERGIVVNREVEIRRPWKHSDTDSGRAQPRGERTDIHVVAAGDGSAITTVIEVKGCWHAELLDAMRTQLRDRYLLDNSSRHGLYLVGWYDCVQWESAHRATRRPPVPTRHELQETLARQATGLSTAGTTLRACVLNAALR